LVSVAVALDAPFFGQVDVFSALLLISDSA
jgi:hypothetical protein